MSEMFTLRQFLDAGTNGFQNGRKMERESIINLLMNRNQNKTHSEGRYCGLCEAIELLKGEQK
jgi:hypothetical protein